MPQPLNAKESSLFRSLVKNYEQKLYKKGGCRLSSGCIIAC